MDISLKIRRDVVAGFFIFAFLFTGYLNTVLRPSMESNITFFRILLPFAFIAFCVFFKSYALRCIGLILIFFLYGFACSYFISRFHNFNFIYFFHYCTLIFVGFLTFAGIHRLGVKSFYNHLRSIYVLMLILAGIQFLTHYEFPNTDFLGTLNIYYWVDNDFGAALASFIPFLWVAPEKKTANKILAGIGALIIAYNGSRIALLSLIVFIIFISVTKIRWLGILLAAVVAVALFYYFKDYKLGGDSLSALLVDPFKHIATLTPYQEAGSIYDRTNALIFGITELLSTGGMGIGPGNATTMLELPEYLLISAKSMHNFIAQVFVEYGWLIVVLLFYGAVTGYNYRRRIGIKVSADRKLYIYLVTVALASLSQSEGLFSNYFFFVSLFAAFSYFGNEQIAANNQADLANKVPRDIPVL
jgi:hypothetical protein